MKDRCYNKHNKCFSLYGERGISICAEWLSDFNAFYSWAMTNGYNDSLTIDRINNDKCYCPENCRWVTQAEQCNNERRNVFITYKGETRTVDVHVAALRKKAGLHIVSVPKIGYRLEVDEA